jgi:hypothetical protein
MFKVWGAARWDLYSVRTYVERRMGPTKRRRKSGRREERTAIKYKLKMETAFSWNCNTIKLCNN